MMKTIDLSNANVDLIVAWKRSGGYEFMRLQTAPPLKDRFAHIVLNADSMLIGREKKAYSIGDDVEKDQYMSVVLESLTPPPSNQRAPDKRLKWARTDQPSEFRRRLVTFDKAAAGISDLRARIARGGSISFYALVLGLQASDRIAYVRHRNPLALLKRGNFLAGLGDTLTLIAQDVFVMDDTIDLILRPDRIDIFNPGYFSSLFFEMSATDRAQHVALTRTALGPLDVTEETLMRIATAIQGARSSRRKMLTLSESQHLTGVTMVKFRSALIKHGVKPAKFIDKSGKISAAEGDVGNLLEILNEDLYDGYLTGRRLVASKKGVRQ